MSTPEQLFTQARTTLVLTQPFFGSLALRLIPVVDTSCPTAWTDGISIGYNPKFFTDLSPSQRVGLLAHEVMHCALGHHFRRQGRDVQKFNVAADHALNPIVKDAGLELPDGALIDPQYKGLSAEAIYNMLPVPPPPKQNQGGQGTPDPNAPLDNSNGWGEVRDSPDPADPTTGEQAWKQATVQAAIAEKMRKGSLSADLQRLVDSIKQPGVSNLLAALLEFVEHSAKSDYRWTRPNPYYTGQGLYLPCLQSDTLPPIGVVIDSSGSVSSSMVEEYLGAIQTVMEIAKPEKMVVLSADSKVRTEQEFEAGDDISPQTVTVKGGGGTSFIPALKRLSELDTPICAAIYLTDLEGDFPKEETEYPVLWVGVTSDMSRHKPPFGQVIYLDR